MTALAMLCAGGALLAERAPGGGTATSGPQAGGSVRAPLGGVLLQASADGSRVWALECTQDCSAVTSQSREQAVEVDGLSGRVLRRLAVTDAVALAPVGRTLWIAHFESGRITRIDPRTGRTTAALTLRLPRPVAASDSRFLPSAITYAEGSLWVSTGRGWVAKLNPRNGKLLALVRSSSEATSTASDGHGIWIADELAGVGQQRPGKGGIRLRGVSWHGYAVDVYSVFAGDGLVWAVGDVGGDPLTGPRRTVVAMVDPRTGRIVRKLQAPETQGAVLLGDALYLGRLDRGRIYRISRDGGMRELPAPRRHAALATGAGNTLWAITTGAPGRLLGVPLAGSGPH